MLESHIIVVYYLLFIQSYIAFGEMVINVQAQKAGGKKQLLP